jgi:hydroxylamine oxidation protein HaoB
LISTALMLIGAALIAWAGSSRLSSQAPYELVRSAAHGEAIPDYQPAGLSAKETELVEIRASAVKNPIATGVAARDADGRLTPLSWRNFVTEPIFFADIVPADDAKVLAAIRKYVPPGAVVLSWWDMSRRIRAVSAGRAPLDDPYARGLLKPNAWAASAGSLDEKVTAIWGSGVPDHEADRFTKFVDALLFDEDRGAAALAELAEGKPAFVAVHLDDLWKLAATRPDLISIAFKDFAGAGVSHGTMKAVRKWIEEQKIEGGYAVEPMGAAVRLHYLPKKADSDRLLARLLPFSTSNPLALKRLQLVYQHKGYWIYQLRDGNG